MILFIPEELKINYFICPTFDLEMIHLQLGEDIKIKWVTEKDIGNDRDVMISCLMFINVSYNTKHV